MKRAVVPSSISPTRIFSIVLVLALVPVLVLTCMRVLCSRPEHEIRAF